jgi:hypothetical protein
MRASSVNLWPFVFLFRLKMTLDLQKAAAGSLGKTMRYLASYGKYLGVWMSNIITNSSSHRNPCKTQLHDFLYKKMRIAPIDHQALRLNSWCSSWSSLLINYAVVSRPNLLLKLIHRRHRYHIPTHDILAKVPRRLLCIILGMLAIPHIKHRIQLL